MHPQSALQIIIIELIAVVFTLLVSADRTSFSFLFSSPVAKREPVLRAYVHGGSRGEAPHSAHAVLLKDLQGLGALAARRQHHLRLQGERGYLFAGKLAGKA